MIKAFLYGRISSEIDLKVHGETTVAEFSIAINKRGKNAGADYFKCKAFNKTAELLDEYFHKGSRIALECTPTQPKKFETKDGKTVYPNVEFIVNAIDFVDTKAESESSKPEPEPSKDDEFMDLPDEPETLGELPFK